MYTVKEAAQQAGLSEHSLRFYTDRNLIPAVKRDANNRRIFDEEAMAQLTTVKCLRECGMSIEGIQRYMALETEGKEALQARLAIVLEQQKTAEQQLQQAGERLGFIRRKVERYRSRIAEAAEKQIF